MFTTALAIVLAVVATVILYFKRAFQYWQRRGVVNLPPKIFFGNTKDVFFQKLGMGCFFRETYFKLKAQGVKSYGGCFIFAKPMLLAFGPDLIKQIVVKDFEHFTDHGNYCNEEVDPLTGTLFIVGGARWKHLRAKLSPTFTSAKMKLMFQTVVDCTRELDVILQKNANDGEPFDVRDVMGRFTTDIIGSCAFGFNCNSLKDPNSEFTKYGKLSFDSSFSRTVKNTLGTIAPEVLRFFNATLFGQDVIDFYSDLVKSTVNYREQNNIYRKDFMHLLIQLKNNVQVSDDPGGNTKQLSNERSKGAVPNLTIEEVIAQAFSFFLAGFETSSITLTFLMYELATNQDIQERLRVEIIQVLDKYDEKLTYDAMAKMTYMDKCINETLRKYPPAPFLMRVCTKEYKIPNTDVVLDKGLLVTIPIHGIQTDPEYFPDPEKYDPERFNDENKAKRHPFTWFPFGEGPRACIGLRFAMMQIRVGLVALLRNYKFRMNSKTKVPIELDSHSFGLCMAGQLWLDLEKINP